jgi:hypothetical protein
VQQEFWQAQEISIAQRKIIEHGLAYFEAEIGWLQDFLRDLESREAKAVKREPRVSVS